MEVVLNNNDLVFEIIQHAFVVDNQKCGVDDKIRRWNFKIIKKIFNVFGSQFKIFTTIASDYYFNLEFKVFGVSNFAHYLSRALGFKTLLNEKSLMKRDESYYRDFIDNIKNMKTNDVFVLKDVPTKGRIELQYLALYYGYSYNFINKSYYEYNAYRYNSNYSKIHNDPRYENSLLTHNFLKSKGIYNPKFYDEIDGLYKFKRDENPGHMRTTELHTIKFVKII
jgi:hypothetical protein